MRICLWHLGQRLKRVFLNFFVSGRLRMIGPRFVDVRGRPALQLIYGITGTGNASPIAGRAGAAMTKAPAADDASRAAARTASRWLRWGVAFVWLWTGLAVFHPY